MVSFNLLRANLRKHIYLRVWRRDLFDGQQSLPENYDLNLAKEIENEWLPKLEQAQAIYSQNIQPKNNATKKYILSMFPYPSGRLHLGHVRVYTTSDILARYYRLRGFQVLHPIGWDSFGLPAENAANERKIRPDIWTEKNIENMKSQLKSMSFSFDWNRELSTCHKSYYKWTQLLFLELYKRGVVYQKEALVNWDPVDKTVLANEQIDADGKSWRSGAKVEKRFLKQWFIKSSVYAKALSQAMDTLNSSDWDLIKNIQSKWIGNCNGCFIEFKLDLDKDLTLPVYTDKAHALYGVSHIFINKNNLLLKHLGERFRETSFVCFASNPLNGSEIPVYLKSDEDYGELNLEGISYMDSKLGVPSIDAADKQFALDNKIEFTDIIDEVSDVLINSEEYSGLKREEVEKLIRKKLRGLNQGGHETSFKLNDWCISRQRKWGTPIPLVYCHNCKIVPVPSEDLPVEFPIDVFSNLSQEENLKLFETKCPRCNEAAKRETDTMDTFVDSSWYFFRYLDVNNKTEIFSGDSANELMPVDVYIGGAEHAMTHLFVSRLVTHFFYQEKKINFFEPFKRFIAMGMIKGESFKASNGKYIPSDLVESRNEKYYIKGTSDELRKDFEKMSKSKLNGIDPEWMIERFGIDFTRLFLVNFVHPKSDRNFSLAPDMIEGTKVIFDRLWKLTLKVDKLLLNEPIQYSRTKDYEAFLSELYKVRNSQLSMIEFNLTNNFNIPSYIVAASKLLKFLAKEKFYEENFFNLFVETLIVFSPMIPHFTSQCWHILRSKIKSSKFDSDKDLVDQKWPEVDPEWKIELLIKNNGKSLLSFYLEKRIIETLDIQSALKMASDFMKDNNKKIIDLEQFNATLDSNLPKNLTINLKRIKI